MTELLPNPDTYLNHIPPAQAVQFEVMRAVEIASLGAIVWDIFSFIPEDVKVLRQGGGLTTLICFVLTRVLAAGYISFWVVMATRPIAHCQAMMFGGNVVCFFLMGVTSFLFLRRVQAVYSGNRLVYWVFTLLYLCCSASHLAPVFGMVSGHIPGTDYCVTLKVNLYASITYFVPETFDTAVFFAISYKIAYQDYQHRHDLPGNLIKRLFSSEALPTLSRALLQGGQQYYLVGLAFRLSAVILLFLPSVPLLYRPILLLPSVVVTSSTTCRVHRLLALAYYKPDRDTSRIPFSHIQFAVPGPKAKRASSHDSIPITVTTQTQVV